MRLFIDKSNKKNLSKLVLVIGGGTILDKAKIYAKKHKKYCIAIPTTGSGASETSHAVIWGKKKINIPTQKPTGVIPPFKIKLPKETRRNTVFDIIGHLVDYLKVCSDNELVEVGMYMGKLIEKHPTNLTHFMSYPLTLKKKIPHGKAIGMILKEAIDKL